MKFFSSPLSTEHSREDFGCGAEELDRYIKQQARLDVSRNVASVFVLTDRNNPTRIAGYYTLSAFSVTLTEIPDVWKRKLPKYPSVPCALVGRLARDLRYPGSGKYILLDAIMRCYEQSATMGINAIVCEAKNDKAKDFYTRFGFVPFSIRSSKMYLTIGTVRKLYI